MKLTPSDLKAYRSMNNCGVRLNTQSVGHLLDTISSIEAERDALKAELDKGELIQWREFSDPPEQSCTVLWLYPRVWPEKWEDGIGSGRWIKGKDGLMGFQEDFEADRQDLAKPTHWAPLPRGPKGEKT